MGGMMDPLGNYDLSTGRMTMDLMYFVVVLVILLNVVFGIILDTFSELRTEKNDRMQDTLEVCFICGIEKETFDKSSNDHQGFRRHIKEDHYMWNYLKFVIFIWEQDKDDDDGLEQYVRRRLDNEDISWFPIGRAMRLDISQQDDDEDVGLKVHRIQNEVEHLKKSQQTVLEKLDKVIEGLGVLQKTGSSMNLMSAEGSDNGDE